MNLFDSIKPKKQDVFHVPVQDAGSIMHKDLLISFTSAKINKSTVYSVKYFKKPEIGDMPYSEYMDYCHFMIDEIGVNTLQECLDTDKNLEHGEEVFSKMTDALEFVQELLEDCSD